MTVIFIMSCDGIAFGLVTFTKFKDDDGDDNTFNVWKKPWQLVHLTLILIVLSSPEISVSVK